MDPLRKWKMRNRWVHIPLLLSTVLGPTTALSQEAAPRPMPQNPSPMVEYTRAHERLEERVLPGLRLSIEGLLPRPVGIFIPDKPARTGPFRLLIHFHGAHFVPEQAVYEARIDYVLAVVNLGPGSGIYDQTFSDPAVFDDLLAAILQQVAPCITGEFSGIDLSGFSAGHGAIRAILREPRHFAAIDGVLLLDGLHTGYDPPRTVLADGGQLEEGQLTPFLLLAEAALSGEKRLLITHSEIFPGTFASTTETTDYLIHTLGLKRTPVLEWGPLGMQQLSLVEQGRFAILGFAGNSAPDHIDHFHAMYHFLALFHEMEAGAAAQSAHATGQGRRLRGRG